MTPMGPGGWHREGVGPCPAPQDARRRDGARTAPCTPPHPAPHPHPAPCPHRAPSPHPAPCTASTTQPGGSASPGGLRGLRTASPGTASPGTGHGPALSQRWGPGPRRSRPRYGASSAPDPGISQGIRRSPSLPGQRRSRAARTHRRSSVYVTARRFFGFIAQGGAGRGRARDFPPPRPRLCPLASPATSCRIPIPGAGNARGARGDPGMPRPWAPGPLPREGGSRVRG